MTPSDFKAWFEGFTEALSGVPTKAQWARVKERVAEIDGKTVTEKVFIDRYWPGLGGLYPYYSLSQPCPYWGYVTTTGGNSTQYGIQQAAQNYQGVSDTAFNAPSAMYALGKADALTTGRN